MSQHSAVANWFFVAAFMVFHLGSGYVYADSINPHHVPAPFGEYEAGITTSVPMARVPGTVPGETAPGYNYPGPTYDFWMGKYEVTNSQYAAFLNDAQLDGGATGRGSNMVFHNDGRITCDGDGLITMFKPHNVASFVDITYDPGASLGSRYQVLNGQEDHPLAGASWIGATKFCNWLTIDHGLGEGQRAYAEGSGYWDWHPLTISTASWQMRDLNDTERQALVDTITGFRLPMDNLGIDWAWNTTVTENAFDEWLRASSYDPAAPNYWRWTMFDTGVNADHWIYGFGRDMLTNADANFMDSGDPFDNGTTPVGFYDGTIYNPDGTPDEDQVFDPGDFITNPNGNLFGIYDLSGNLWELGQDQVATPSRRALHGGGAGTALGSIGALKTTNRAEVFADGDLGGFRVIAVPEPTTTLLLTLGSLALLHHRRTSARPPLCWAKRPSSSCSSRVSTCGRTVRSRWTNCIRWRKSTPTREESRSIGPEGADRSLLLCSCSDAGALDLQAGVRL